MDLYNLGKVPWQDSQLMYHALASLGREALCLVSPATPYVCIGFHQDVEQDVDLDYCRRNNIPVFRREVGGGAVYLDGDQLFYQVVLGKDNPLVSKNKAAFYRKFLQPVINVYRAIGIPAEYKPINDLISGTRKISGTGAGEIGDSVVFVGNLIVDFNYDMMTRVLKVPDEKFRDKVHKTLTENLSTIRRELGESESEKWDESRLNALLAAEFGELLGPMESRRPDRELKTKMAELGQWMLKDAWLFQKGKRVTGKDIKIRAGIEVIHKVRKTPGGIIRADYEVKEGRFGRMSLSGDFFCFPPDALAGLESRLKDQSVVDARDIILRFYSQDNMETPGVEIADWMQVLSK